MKYREKEQIDVKLSSATGELITVPDPAPITTGSNIEPYKIESSSDRRHSKDTPFGLNPVLKQSLSIMKGRAPLLLSIAILIDVAGIRFAAYSSRFDVALLIISCALALIWFSRAMSGLIRKSKFTERNEFLFLLIGFFAICCFITIGLHVIVPRSFDLQALQLIMWSSVVLASTFLAFVLWSLISLRNDPK